MTFSAAMSACVERWPYALQLLQDMELQQLEADVVVSTAMLSALGHGGHWPECLHMAQGLRPMGRATENALLTALQRCAQWPHVLLLFDRKADGIGYAAAIGAYGAAHRWQEALELYRGTKENTILLNVAINACAESFQWPQALDLLRTESPDLISYNSAITACGLATEWQQALNIFARMPQKDVLAYQSCLLLRSS